MANRVPPTIALRCCPLFITAELACERVHIVAPVFGLRLIQRRMRNGNPLLLQSSVLRPAAKPGLFALTTRLKQPPVTAREGNA